ncbi:hypothetical protein KQI22_12760 [Kineothrix sp. MSJ-39]|uniref:hypothetical protein n=1 Tax=Kineothrix sp. MSJ-39 TaxID=2841533 RepID=UPI001C1048E0|nr:hypothetical protein [Kineothrix sp. MSJ-39]MBU5430920.1 hypothetical protein [Kineothrix sp. MSJ-39]
MKNKKIALSAVLVGSMLLSTSFSVYAESQNNEIGQIAQENTKKEEATETGIASYTKNENVYASLAADGTASDAYVVNHFSVGNAGKIVDYGKYDSIKNLTTLGSLTKKDDSVDFQAEDGEFYYQGQIKNVELPWKFAISYRMDGKSVTADELAGKTGKLEIRFQSTKNDKADESFYDHYLMQVSLTLDSEKTKNIVADGATVADAGAGRQLSFTALPGSDASFVIKADVSDFIMSGFSIAAVPYSMDIDMDQFNTDDFTGQVSELTDAVDKLNDGTKGLSDGMGKLCDGNEDLLSGSSRIQSGLNELSGNAATIIDASSQIKGALDKISEQLKNADFSGMSKLSKLPDGLSELAVALDNMQSGLVTLETNYTKAFTALDQLIQTETGTLTEEELGALQGCVQENTDASAAYQKLMASYQQLLTIKGAYQNVKPVFEAIQTTLSSENEQSVVNGISSISSNLKGIADSLSEVSGTDIAGQMNTLQKGLESLASQYGEFHNGLSSYTAGVGMLSANYGTFHNGLASYLNGTEKIKDGTLDLSDGMKQFSDGISDMPTQIQDTIDEMIGSFSGDDYEAVSFTDGKNENITSVQFVISTKGIEKAETEKVAEPEEKQGFGDRLKALFTK